MRLLVMSAWIMLVIVGLSGAQIPRIINYQGHLTDDMGEPVTDGEYPVRFRIWDDSTDGMIKWTSQPETVLVVNGLFNFQLGSEENIPPSTFDDTSLWLGITVGTGPEVPEIEPRTRLVSAPYAFKAYKAEYAGYADSAGIVLSDDGDWTVDGSNVYRMTGSVGIGTDGPTEVLEIVGNAHIEGNLTWQEKTGYVAISAAAFGPGVDGYDYLNVGQSLEYNGGTVWGLFHAQVQLPQGAEVDRMTCYWEDSTSENGAFSLHRSHLIDGSDDDMGFVETSGDGGNGSSYDDSIEYGLVDNIQYAYFIRAKLYLDMALYGIVIEYRFTEPY